MRIEFEIIWSNKWYYLPVSMIKKDGNYIGYTNRFKKFTYRLKPIIKFKK